MVESSNEGYKVQFVKYDLTRGHCEYLIKVMGPGGNTFHIKDRYSSMRNFQSIIKRNFNLKAYQGFPNFPEKKLFGNKGEGFLANRMTALNNFFNNFFSIQDIAKSNNILIYFKENAVD